MGGAFFLSLYGAKSALAVFNPKPLIHWEVSSANPQGFWGVALTTLALTFLNPYVYLDTVVLVGGVAAQYDLTPRTYFILGVIFASCTWFYSLALFSVKGASFFETKGGVRLLDGMVCAVLWMVALSLIKSEIA
jgi:L-lysine exporter family protein LysE/ArgO